MEKQVLKYYLLSKKGLLKAIENDYYLIMLVVKNLRKQKIHFQSTLFPAIHFIFVANPATKGSQFYRGLD